MALAPGTRLGAYEIADLIGAGGMGEVDKARDSRLDRFVAIKVLPGAPSATQGWERLLLEARGGLPVDAPLRYGQQIAGALAHPMVAVSCIAISPVPHAITRQYLLFDTSSPPV